jgi:hypothetical protein
VIVSLRALLGASVTLSLACIATPLLAQQGDEQYLTAGHRRRTVSPQNFAAEVRFGLFNPAIDSDPSLQGAPYKEVFGTAPRLLVSAELDWQAYRIPHFGSIGPGVGLGYASMSDPAPFQTPHNGSILSGETTTLEIVPFYAVAVVRVDALWRELHVPLVPYVKAGLADALWRASNTLGTSTVNGVSGEGHSFGTHYAFGLALNLNPFDPYAAGGFDDAMGVNNTYIFGEYTRDDLTGLGLQSGVLRVGGPAWTFGFAFEF